jgi:cytochrome c oxidase subunit 2
VGPLSQIQQVAHRVLTHAHAGRSHRRRGADRYNAARQIEISAKKFEFTPNVVTLKKEKPVTIHFTSTDRAHGLFIKALKIDLDADAGKPADVTVTPHEAGSFGAICDHYCGAGHGNMKMTFVVE